MFPIFHVFIPLLGFELYLQIRQSTSSNFGRIWIIVGALLPDLLDKPFSLLFPDIFSGRGLFHTPFIWLIFLFFFNLIFKRKFITFTLGYGIISHLLLDIPGIPWLWPIQPFQFYDIEISDFLKTILSDPVVQITEICGIFGTLGLLWYNEIIFSYNFINWKKLQSFLFQHPTIIGSFKKKIK